MSAEPYDTAAAVPQPGMPQDGLSQTDLPQAPAAVDILPVQGTRKGRPAEAAPVAPPPSVDPSWGAPAPTMNPWTGEPAAAVAPAPVDPAAYAPVPPPPPQVPAPPAAPPAPAAQTPLVYGGAIPPPVSVPVFPGGGVPTADPSQPVEQPSDGTTPGAKRFLGMQLRRPRRGDEDTDPADTLEPGPPAPVAAWPTDVGLPVVATAEPATPAPWGPPVGYAADETLVPAAADSAPAEAPPVEAPAGPPVEASVDVPVEPVAVEAPVDVPVEPVAVEAPVAPVAVEPVLTPVPVPPADDQVRALRVVVEASEAQRTAAEQRADNAVAYAQQLQTELTRVQGELDSKVQAAEVRVRTAANEAQDWQIRHREAQTQITELAASLAGAEQRLADVRAERDELMTQLEEATEPSRDARDAAEVAAELEV